MTKVYLVNKWDYGPYADYRYKAMKIFKSKEDADEFAKAEGKCEVVEIEAEGV
jgi:hypothetical protein